MLLIKVMLNIAKVSYQLKENSKIFQQMLSLTKISNIWMDIISSKNMSSLNSSKISFFDFIDPLGNFWASHTDLIESYCFLEQTNKHKSSNKYLMVYNRKNSSYYNNNSHNSDQIEKSYRNIVSNRIRHRQPYSNITTKNQICICNGESDDIVYILNKYNLEFHK